MQTVYVSNVKLRDTGLLDSEALPLSEVCTWSTMTNMPESAADTAFALTRRRSHEQKVHGQHCIQLKVA